MKTELEIKALIKQNKLILRQEQKDFKLEKSQVSRMIARDYILILKAEIETLKWVLTGEK